jgi:hypothetical protein
MCLYLRFAHIRDTHMEHMLDLQQKEEELCLVRSNTCHCDIYRSICGLNADIPNYHMGLQRMFNQDIVSIQLNHYRKRI